jgi:hypothetical protein
MTDRRATVTFELGKNTFTHEQIVTLRSKGRTIGTITPSETGVIVWSLHTLTTQTRDGGGPGNGIDISFTGDGADDDDVPRSH